MAGTSLYNTPSAIIYIPGRAQTWLVFWTDQDVLESIYKVKLGTESIHSVLLNEFDCMIKHHKEAHEEVSIHVVIDGTPWYAMTVHG